MRVFLWYSALSTTYDNLYNLTVHKNMLVSLIPRFYLLLKEEMRCLGLTSGHITCNSILCYLISPLVIIVTISNCDCVYTHFIWTWDNSHHAVCVPLSVCVPLHSTTYSYTMVFTLFWWSMFALAESSRTVISLCPFSHAMMSAVWPELCIGLQEASTIHVIIIIDPIYEDIKPHVDRLNSL